MINWTKYAKTIKRLAIVPLIAGAVSLAEGFFPNHTIKTTVISKRESYRLKTNTTTYTIEFEGIDDQFTEKIYNAINENDSVILSATYFNKQISSIKNLSNGETMDNDTGEVYAVYGFAIAFLLAGLLVFKKGVPANWQLKAAAILTLFSSITIIRWFV